MKKHRFMSKNEAKIRVYLCESVSNIKSVNQSGLICALRSLCPILRPGE
jgi:hypothetical protein